MISLTDVVPLWCCGVQGTRVQGRVGFTTVQTGATVVRAEMNLLNLCIFPTVLTAYRHDLNIKQDGEKTSTTLRHFLLCDAGQVHDLHTSLVLDHPDGTANQLHKCIVSDATGHGIFDGNVQVPCTGTLYS